MPPAKQNFLTMFIAHADMMLTALKGLKTRKGCEPFISCSREVHTHTHVRAHAITRAHMHACTEAHKPTHERQTRKGPCDTSILLPRAMKVERPPDRKRAGILNDIGPRPPQASAQIAWTQCVGRPKAISPTGGGRPKDCFRVLSCGRVLG